MSCLYSFVTPQFGRIHLDAGLSRPEALLVRRRFRDASRLEASQVYRHCDRCDSRPCCCEELAAGIEVSP